MRSSCIYLNISEPVIYWLVRVICPAISLYVTFSLSPCPSRFSNLSRVLLLILPISVLSPSLHCHIFTMYLTLYLILRVWCRNPDLRCGGANHEHIVRPLSTNHFLGSLTTRPSGGMEMNGLSLPFKLLAVLSLL